MKNWLRVTICIMLVVSVLAMSLSVFAEEENPLLQANDQTVAFLVWQLLKSWGIDIQYQGISQFTTEVQNEILNWIFDYLEDQPSIESIGAWIADWIFNTDFWGNLVVNNSLMDDVRAFADWLVNEKGLTDNSTQVLNPTYTVNGATVFYSNVYYESEDYYKSGVKYVAMAASPDDFALDEGIHPFWCVLQNTQYNTFYLLSFKLVEEDYGFPRYYKGLTDDGVDTEIQGSNYGWQISKFGYRFGIMPFYPSSDPLSGNGINIPTTFTPLTTNSSANGGYNMLYGFLNSITDFDLEMEGDNRIVVTTKIIPIPGEDYTTDDSMTIIDGQPSYIEINWPDEIAISNLPAVVSTGTIENPHLEEAYRPIQGLITYTKDGISVITSLLYELPDEMVYMWYGLLASIVIWGMIKLMREH